jgi:hypothetical protein
LALKNLVIISEIPSLIGRSAQSPFEWLSSLIPFLIQGGLRRLMRDADARHWLEDKSALLTKRCRQMRDAREEDGRRIEEA